MPRLSASDVSLPFAVAFADFIPLAGAEGREPQVTAARRQRRV